MKYYLQETAGNQFISRVTLNPEDGFYFQSFLPPDWFTLRRARLYKNLLENKIDPSYHRHICGTPLNIIPIIQK